MIIKFWWLLSSTKHFCSVWLLKRVPYFPVSNEAAHFAVYHSLRAVILLFCRIFASLSSIFHDHAQLLSDYWAVSTNLQVISSSHGWSPLIYESLLSAFDYVLFDGEGFPQLPLSAFSLTQLFSWKHPFLSWQSFPPLFWLRLPWVCLQNLCFWLPIL